MTGVVTFPRSRSKRAEIKPPVIEHILSQADGVPRGYMIIAATKDGFGASALPVLLEKDGPPDGMVFSNIVNSVFSGVKGLKVGIVLGPNSMTLQ